MDKTIILIFIIKLIFWTQTEATERWSRQIANSDWVPLTNHRHNQRSHSHSQENVFASSLQTNRASPVSLSPPLQKQYEDQLLQLQKTQESIQKLLDLQEQLRIQQHLLQSHAYIQDGIKSQEGEKESIPQSRIQNLQAVPQLVPENLTPPNSGFKSLSPLFSESNQHSKGDRHKIIRNYGTSKHHQDSDNRHKVNTEQYLKDAKHDTTSDESFESHKRYKNDNKIKFPSQTWTKQDESDDEEIQLVYVPAEALLSKGQEKNDKDRSQKKQNYNTYQDNSGIHFPPGMLNQKSFSLKHFDQSPESINEDGQYFKEEIKEVTRDFEPEAIKDENKQNEYSSRDKQEQERRKVPASRTKEGRIRQNQNKYEQYNKQAALERKKDSEYQKNVNYQNDMDYSRELHRLKDTISQEGSLPRQRELEKHSYQSAFREHLPSRNEQFMTQDIYFNEEKIPQTQSLIHNGQHQQYSTEDINNVTNNRKNKYRPQIEQRYTTYNKDDMTTAPLSPNQPPLSIYMATNLDAQNVDVNHLLELLQNAKTIAVIDTVLPNTPKVFVGPAYLDNLVGYVKFDLPYLSSIEHYLLEKDLNRFPFFVAPLSFVPPRNYFKIPFPAPHIGSIIVSNIEKTTEPEVYKNRQNSSPSTEFNSYTFNSYPTSNDKIETTTEYSTGVSNSAIYKDSQYYQDRKPTSASVFEKEEQLKNTDYFNTYPTSPNYRESSYVTPSYQSNFPQSTLQYEQDTLSDIQTGKHSYTPTYVTGNQEHVVDNQHIQSNVEPLGPPATNNYYTSHYESEKKPVTKSSQYNLSAKLPAISSQLPGLVNSLMEKNEDIPPLTTPLTTSTPASTTETPTTTTTRGRGRQRGRVVTTKSTTLRPPVKSSTSRSQRPFTRSRTRLTTTTEQYQRNPYDPKKSKPETTNVHYTENESRNPLNAKHPKVRGRTHKPNQPKISDRLPNEGGFPSSQQQGGKTYSHHSSTAYQMNDDEVSRLQSHSNSQDYTNQAHHLKPSDYENQQIYQQDRQFRNESDLSPIVNAEHNKELVYDLKYHTAATPTPAKDYSYYQSKKSGNKEYASVDPTQVSEVDEPYQQDYLQYNGAFPNQNSPNDNYESTERLNFENYQTGVTNSFDTSQSDYSIQNGKQFNYDPQSHTTVQSTAKLLTDFPVTPSTINTHLSGPIREKTREHSHGRVQPELQTHNEKSQPEFVRFSSAIRQQTKKPSPHLVNRNRENLPSRLKTRTRPNHKDSQIQTDGQEYVRIQSALNEKDSIVTSATPESVTTFETSDGLEEYGFVRAPNFQPSQSEENIPNFHLKPKENQGRIKNEPEGAAVFPESVPQRHDPKKRPTYLSFNRNYPNNVATTMRTSISPEQHKDTGSLKSKTEETKTTKVRGRVRRPGRKRTTTTTTEAALEDRNELQFNENYFHTAEVTPKSFSSPNNNKQLYFNRRNLPNRKQENIEISQEFVLNVPKSNEDQSEQSGISYQKHTINSNAAKKFIPQFESSDIYEAESQWSTKVANNVFQQIHPLHNTTDLVSNDNYTQNQENNDHFDETTTAGSEIKDNISIDTLTHYENIFNQDSNENYNMEQTGYPEIMTSILNNNNSDEENNNYNDDNSNHYSNNENIDNKSNVNSESTTVQTNYDLLQDKIKDDSERDVTTVLPLKDAPRRKVGFRKRKVKIRVHPIREQFVTAESQNYGSPINTLNRQSSKDHMIDDMFRDDKPSFNLNEQTSSEINNDYMEMFKEPKESIEMMKEISKLPSIVTEQDANKKLTDETTITVEATNTAKITDFDKSLDFTESPNSANVEESKMQEEKIQAQTEESTKSSNEIKITDNKINLSTLVHPKNHRLEWSELKSTNLSHYNIAKNETSSRTQTMLENVKDGGKKEENKENKITDYVQAIFDSINNDNENRKVERSFLRPVQFANHQVSSHSFDDITKLQKTNDTNSNLPIKLSPKLPEVTKLGEVLRTSTTTKVSHMTEICYRGRCVMSKPKVDHST